MSRRISRSFPRVQADITVLIWLTKQEIFASRLTIEISTNFSEPIPCLIQRAIRYT
jgi:hypothetical protein